MGNTQQELLKKLSNESSINEIQSYIKAIMEIRGFNKEKSSDKILLLIELRRIQGFIFCRYGW